MDRSVLFYKECFDAELILDTQLAGARNVFMRIGNGRLHIYDQPPKKPGRGSIHHFGIQTDDIRGVVRKMKSKGVEFKKGITDFGFWKYIMVPAPDDILIELFEVDKNTIPPQLSTYFE